MDFDPLSLFSPRAQSTSRSSIVSEDNDLEPLDNEKSSETPESRLEDLDKEDEEDKMAPLHVLDLPILRLQPQGKVLLVVLRLLASNQVYNFESVEERHDDVEKLFKDKDVSIEMAKDCVSWLSLNCPRLSDIDRLASLPSLGFQLKQQPSYNEWLTRIISSDLRWIQTESERDQIHKEASLRISENCGRMAQPEIIRKVTFRNMCRLERDFIELKEPSMTSDNLGLKTWGSSLILSQKLIDRPTMLASPILELGSGTGLVGIVATLLGFGDVFLTDLKEIVPNLRENVEMNGSTAHVDELDWSDPSCFLEKFPHILFKTIILSDPIYSFDHPPLILNVLSTFATSDTKVIIQVPIRRNYEDVRTQLWDLMNDKFKVIREVNESGPDEFGDVEYCLKIFVLK